MGAQAVVGPKDEVLGRQIMDDMSPRGRLMGQDRGGIACELALQVVDEKGDLQASSLPAITGRLLRLPANAQSAP